MAECCWKAYAANQLVSLSSHWLSDGHPPEACVTKISTGKFTYYYMSSSAWDYLSPIGAAIIKTVDDWASGLQGREAVWRWSWQHKEQPDIDEFGWFPRVIGDAWGINEGHSKEWNILGMIRLPAITQLRVDPYLSKKLALWVGENAICYCKCYSWAFFFFFFE